MSGLARVRFSGLAHAVGGLRADAAEVGKLAEQVQGLAVVDRQCRMQRESRVAGEAGSSVFRQIDKLGFEICFRKINAIDEVLHVFHGQRERAGELPLVGEVAEDKVGHRQR